MGGGWGQNLRTGQMSGTENATATVAALQAEVQRIDGELWALSSVQFGSRESEEVKDVGELAEMVQLLQKLAELADQTAGVAWDAQKKLATLLHGQKGSEMYGWFCERTGRTIGLPGELNLSTAFLEKYKAAQRVYDDRVKGEIARLTKELEDARGQLTAAGGEEPPLHAHPHLGDPFGEA